MVGMSWNQGPLERQSPPAANQRASNVSIGDTTSIRQAVDHLEHFSRRVLIEAMLDGWAHTWERAARRFEAARPIPGEFHGNATLDELRAKWRELTAMAQACRARAAVSPLELVVEDVDAVLDEVA